MLQDVARDDDVETRREPDVLYRDDDVTASGRDVSRQICSGPKPLDELRDRRFGGEMKYGLVADEIGMAFEIHPEQAMAFQRAAGGAERIQPRWRTDGKESMRLTAQG